jgi:hypothetical protein
LQLPAAGTFSSSERHFSVGERETKHGFWKRRTALAARRAAAGDLAFGSVLAPLMICLPLADALNQFQNQLVRAAGLLLNKPSAQNEIPTQNDQSAMS